MLDVVALAMLVVVPVLGASVYLVKFRRQYALHKKIQLTLGSALLVTVLLFEADMRLGGWRHRAEASPFAGVGGSTDWVSVALAIHLCFAVTSALLWVVVIARRCAVFPVRRCLRRTARGTAASAWRRQSTWCVPR